MEKMPKDEDGGNVSVLVENGSRPTTNGSSPTAEGASETPESIEEGGETPEELEPLTAVVERYSQHATRKADVDDLRATWREEDAEGVRRSLEEPLGVIRERKDASVALQKKLEAGYALLGELVDVAKADPEQWQSNLRRSPAIAQAIADLIEAQTHATGEKLNELVERWSVEREPQIQKQAYQALYKELLVGELRPLFRELEAGKFKSVAEVGQAMYDAGFRAGLKDKGKAETVQQKVEARDGQGPAAAAGRVSGITKPEDLDRISTGEWLLMPVERRQQMLEQARRAAR